MPAEDAWWQSYILSLLQNSKSSKNTFIHQALYYIQVCCDPLTFLCNYLMKQVVLSDHFS